jgi:DNA-binding response OmpR family regulator
MSVLGKRILIVEDEALVAMLVEDIVEDLGGIPIGPASTIEKGLSLALSESIDAAVLDVNIRGESIGPVARLLSERRIPIVVTSGYGAQANLDGVAADVIFEKPFDADQLANALVELTKAGSG